MICWVEIVGFLHVMTLRTNTCRASQKCNTWVHLFAWLIIISKHRKFNRLFRTWTGQCFKCCSIYLICLVCQYVVKVIYYLSLYF
jgi:hypothetical protein